MDAPTKYTVTFAQMAIDFLPPDKRFPVIAALLRVFLFPLQYLHDILTGSYYDGSTDPDYSPGTYNKGDRVIFKKSVFESLIDGNTDAPDQITWYLVQDNFIGISERMKYNGQHIVLEYALNKWFGTTFRQPGEGISDIYTTTNPNLLNVFRSGGSNANSSITYANTSSEFSINDYSFSEIINLNLYVPAAVFSALSNNDGNREAIVRAFADKYIAGGIIYQVIPY